jgi:hypothetical protein
MSLPDALVKVTLLRLRNVDVSAFATTPNPFVVARIGPRVLGRKSITAAATIVIDEPTSPFVFEIAVTAGQSVDVRLDVWDERGTQAPVAVLAFTASIAQNWASAPEVAAPEASGGAGELVYRIETTRLPALQPVAPVSRSAPGASAGGNVVVVQPTAAIELTEVRGLYRPGAPAATAGATPMLAEPEPGYTSDDDRGRIYLDRDLHGHWHRDRQAIEITAQVYIAGGALPSGAKVKWTVIDPDDPTNDYRLETSDAGPPPGSPPNVVQEWGRYLDTNDYSGTTAPSTASDGDNTGTIRHTPRFQEIDPYALNVTNDPVEAETRIRRGISKVRIHCSSHAGDNLIVRAEVVHAPTFQTIAAQTGVMTLWQRIQVEYIRIDGAMDLPVVSVPPHFYPAFVEMNFWTGRQNLRNPGPNDTIASTEPVFRRRIVTFIQNHFTHAGQGGWFCLLSALKPYTAVAQGWIYADSTGAWGPGTAGTGAHANVGGMTIKDYIDVPNLNVSNGSPGAIVVQQPNNARLMFNVAAADPPDAAGTVRCWLLPHDIASGFTAGTGDLDAQTASSQNHYLTDPVASGGYGISGAVQVKVAARGHYPGGTSPTIQVGAHEYFAGRTAIFTSGRTNPDETIDAIVHELTHGLGFPHKCGFWDFETPRTHSCCMNYPIHGIWDQPDTSNATLVPVPSDTRGRNHCGRHLREIRNVRLGSNRGLGW